MNSVLRLSNLLPVFVMVAAGTPSYPRAPEAYTIRFENELGLHRDLRLAAPSDSVVLSFFCESGSKPDGGSLHLFIQRSPAVETTRSYLTVSLNYGVLRSVRLDMPTRTEVEIPIPPALLKRENRLEIAVRQYPASGAAEPALWTAVGSGSFITIRSRTTAGNGDLNDFPVPLIDPYSYRAKSIDVLLPAGISSATLEATVWLVANLCRRVAPEPVQVRVVRSFGEGRHPLLVAGTPEEQPSLEQIDSADPAALTTGEGLAVLTSVARAGVRPVLVVTGRTPHAVKNAARALFDPGRPKSGTSLRSGAVTGNAPATPHQWPGFIPPGGSFTLRDLRYNDFPIGPGNFFVASIPLRASPDFRFTGYPMEMVLYLKAASALGSGRGRIVVMLNGQSLGSWAINEVLAGTEGTLKIQFPGERLATNNLLQVVVEGEPAPALMLLASSRFAFPQDFSVTLPDLSLLQHALYPLSIKADLSDTILLVPSTATAESFAMTIAVAAQLGRLAPGTTLAPRVRKMEEVTSGERTSSHFVFLRSSAQDETPDVLFRGWPANAASSRPSLQEVVSPWNQKRVILLIDASREKSPETLIERVFQPEVLTKLAGDTVVLNRGQIRWQRMSPVVYHREIAWINHVQAWLGATWYGIPLIVITVSVMMAAGWRLGLHHYRTRRAP